MLSPTDITTLFDRIAQLRIAVIGDFALDLYVPLNTETGEYSIETGKVVFWGSQPRTSLGGAGNVVQNLVALGATDIRVIGCVGNDLFGREMRHLFAQAGVDTHWLHTPPQWDTCTYTKPMRANEEASRIDFGTHNELTDKYVNTLLADLEQALPQLDLLIINQQFPNPLLTAERAARLNDLLSRYSAGCYVADMRHVGQQLPNALLKVNTAELAWLLAIELPDQPDFEWCVQYGQQLQQQRSSPVVITRGEAGLLYVDGERIESVAGLKLTEPLDTVGAGDTVVAAFGACLGAGATPRQALEIANLAAGVTIQKLQQTGTATRTEILDVYLTHFPHEPSHDSTMAAGTAHPPD